MFKKLLKKLFKKEEKNTINIPLFSPLKKNRFIVEYMNVPNFLVKTVNILENKLVIKYWETEGYSPFKYFENLDEFGKELIIEYLNPYGEIVRRDTFIGLKKENLNSEKYLSYDSFENIYTYLTLGYTERKVEIIGENKIK